MMSDPLTTALALLALVAACVGWGLVQRWARLVDPECQGPKIGCARLSGGECSGRCGKPTDDVARPALERPAS